MVYFSDNLHCIKVSFYRTREFIKSWNHNIFLLKRMQLNNEPGTNLCGFVFPNYECVVNKDRT